MNFGEKLRAARQAQNISRQELAEKTGISLRTIVNYETYSVIPKKRETYTKLADALHVSEESLIDDNVDFVLRANEKYGSRGMNQAKHLVEDVRALWAGGEMAEEDIDEIMRSLQEAYWDIKEKNRKYAAKSKGNKHDDRR